MRLLPAPHSRESGNPENAIADLVTIVLSTLFAFACPRGVMDNALASEAGNTGSIPVGGMYFVPG